MQDFIHIIKLINTNLHSMSSKLQPIPNSTIMIKVVTVKAAVDNFGRDIILNKIRENRLHY